MISVEPPIREIFFSFFRCQISCSHKLQVEANKNISAMFIARKLNLECC